MLRPTTCSCCSKWAICPRRCRRQWRRTFSSAPTAVTRRLCFRQCSLARMRRKEDSPSNKSRKWLSCQMSQCQIIKKQLICNSNDRAWLYWTQFCIGIEQVYRIRQYFVCSAKTDTADTTDTTTPGKQDRCWFLDCTHGTVEMYIPGPVCCKGSVNWIC